MNTTLIIISIISFSFLGETLTWISRKDRISVFSYVSFIRVIAICVSISTIYHIDKQYNDYKFLNEANSFKQELIQHQDSLINYQKTMINELTNHLWEEHDCDIPQFDGVLKDNIDYEEQYLDSLYNKEL